MDQIFALVHKFSIFDILDILIVSYVFYRVILLIRGTRAVQLVKGILVLLVAAGLSRVLHLQALNWLLDEVLTVGFFAVPVVFQPELRRALDQLGRTSLFHFSGTMQGTRDANRTQKEIVAAAQVFAKNHIGALIVLERDTGLSEYVETGIAIGAIVSKEFLINGFIPNTPLHDGAMIICDDRVTAASCYLPLSDSLALGKELGTRHRAAVGITEQTDALALVVSEETGKISIAEAGQLYRDLDEAGLMERLLQGMNPARHATFRLWRKAGTP